MAFEWLNLIHELPEILGQLSGLIKGNRVLKDQLIRELRLNLKAFETAQKSKAMDYDKLLELLHNAQIQAARKQRFTFATIKSGEVKACHVFNPRNEKYIGRDCAWLFKNIDEKIEDLRMQKQYHGSLNALADRNIALQFSNLFYKLKLTADFIVD